MTVLVVEVPDRVGTDTVAGWLVALEELLDTGRPFGLVFDYADRTPRQQAGAKAAQRAWLDRNRSRFARACVGIALAHHEAGARRQVERVAATGLAERWFGCPCRPVASVRLGQEWVASRLQQQAVAG